MSRLTKDIREQMARALVAHRYKAEAEALAQLNRTLADRAYTHIYTPEVQGAMETLEKAFGEGLFDNVKYGLRVLAGSGYKVTIGGPLSSRWVDFLKDEHGGYKITGRYLDHRITDEALAKEVQEFADRYRKFDAGCETAYYEALAVLNTVTTGKKLAEVWPEAMPVIGDLVPAECRTLPTVKVADINEKFGLPPQEAETTDAN